MRTFRRKEVAATLLRHTTDLIVGAHPDDVELLGLTSIGQSASTITAVVCTDGAGGPRAPGYEGLTSIEFVRCRRDEQLAAAKIGHYEQLILMELRSEEVKAHPSILVGPLANVMTSVRPARILTHNPADKHLTHVRVAQAAIEAARCSLGAGTTVLGVEVWRGLDWLPDAEKVCLATDGLDELEEQLLVPFQSQLAGKRYDLASAGRRRANATFANPAALDELSSAVLALDLSPVVNGHCTLQALLERHLDVFRAEVLAALESGP